MQADLRRAFNAAFTDDTYPSFVRTMETRLGCPFGFRVAETPAFIPADLREKLDRAANEIVVQLCDSKRLAAMERDVPERYATPGRGSMSGVAIVDFAITRNERGELEPKLVELQGFPSLFALTCVQLDEWGKVCSRMPGMPAKWSGYFSGLTEESFIALFRRSVVGKHRPEDVILLDLHPEKQKTNPDFFATQQISGVEAVCPTTLVRDGRRLLRRRGGKLLEVKRIYHRLVFDELEKSGAQLPYDYRDELEVEWFPHPQWYFVWSKSSLPHLDHPAVPKTRRLSELDSVPKDLSRYVLKPFYSFAGGGVNVDPTESDVAAVPADQRENWCLQEKVEYAPVIQAVDGGGVKIEVRMMFLRPDEDSKLTLATNLVRLSRGKMLGVDFNKNFTWVGGSVGMWPA